MYSQQRQKDNYRINKQQVREGGKQDIEEFNEIKRNKKLWLFLTFKTEKIH